MARKQVNRPRAKETEAPPSTTSDAADARELYLREKARRARQARRLDPLADARQAYQALLAAKAGTARGGRPRKVAARPQPAETESESADDAVLDGDAPDASPSHLELGDPEG